MTIEKLTIQEYNLYDFTKAIEQGVLLGYELTDSNEDSPVQLGHVYYCSMVRPALNLKDGAVLVEVLETLKPEEEQQPIPTLAKGFVMPVAKAKRGVK